MGVGTGGERVLALTNRSRTEIDARDDRSLKELQDEDHQNTQIMLGEKKQNKTNFYFWK